HPLGSYAKPQAAEGPLSLVRVSMIEGKRKRAFSPALSRAITMRRFTHFWVLALWAGLSAAPVRAGQLGEDEVTLKEAKLQTDTLLSAAVRLMAQRKPPEASKLLLDFAPSAGHVEVLEVIRDVLPQLAVRDGKPDPALKAALTDKEGLRRALAVEALIRAKQLHGEAAHKFLADG